MKLKRIAVTFFLLTSALVCIESAAQEAVAHEATDGPTALVVQYHARPGSRVAFRKAMAGEGVARFNRWKSEGVFQSYNALFTSYAGDSVPDMFLILRFNHFSELAKWQKIEESYPGGLDEKAQALASADYTATTVTIQELPGSGPTKDSQYFIVEYSVTTDPAKYSSYVKGYVVPQFTAWNKAGALASYNCYLNQNPAGAPWGSLFILQYTDLKALAAREEIKAKARVELAQSDPVWKKWSEDKSSLRVEKAGIPVRSLN